MEFCNCYLVCALPYVNSSFAIILMVKRNHIVLFSLSSCVLQLLFCSSLRCHGYWLQFVIVIFHYHKGDFKNNASISLINVYRLSKADLLFKIILRYVVNVFLASCQVSSL